MPNGGVMPCCFICKWAQRESDETQWGASIKCAKHAFHVAWPRQFFCSELADEFGDILPIIERENISPNRLYAWIEIQYQTQKYPALPQYHHELVDFAPISIWAVWSDDERQAEYRKRYDEKLKDFEQKYGS